MGKQRKFEFKTPVLYLVFNRLDTVKKTFPEIQKAKPEQLFIACDGPRNEKEKAKTDAVRKYILDNINWKCEVNTLFRDKNLGCKYAVAGAIDWFFENVEWGIILEDDCLPSQSFFRFCQEMLEKYKNNKKVMQISGTNIEGKGDVSKDYFFSKVFSIWGWATWKRAWDKYDVEMKLWGGINQWEFIRKINRDLIDQIRSKRLYDLIYHNKMDTWDYQWSFICQLNNGMDVIPGVNLITNIGFEKDSTHTGSSDLKRMSINRYEMEFPLKTNNNFKISKDYDIKTVKFYRGTLISLALRKIKKLLKIRG